ncbi:hypothetical protein [Kurthia sibirica]|uniref:Uncharacterized protein n=1 Tax=Kurthia sibirica TaxID=202750 RepID=A0A2U3ANI5_9BACL|nr:hypothetical protein [Kurthia sibirica]PWI26059.1 hypothetical protein DEX24_05890 [Kurthia sibirica]GEK34790.1 hypothetical protein KSI01_23230 [Kurthia sibirica]
MNKKTSVFTKILLSATLLVSTVAIASPAQAAVKTHTLKTAGTTTITRSLDKEGMDIFKFDVTKDGAVKIAIKDAKKKGLSLSIFTNINENAMDDILNKPLGELTSKETDKFMDLMSKVKVVDYLINDTMSDGMLEINNVQMGLKKGHYYVLVASDSTGKKNRDYSLTMTSSNKLVELESNDTMSIATAIKRSKVYAASLNMIDEKDYFKVIVPESGKLVVKSTTTKRADMTYNFYDSKKKKMAKTVKRTGKNYHAETTVKKGVYYVKVTGDAMFTTGDDRVNYSMKAYVKTAAPSVQVTNKKGKSKDTITVKGLQKGAQVKLYSDAKKKKLITSKKATASTMTVNTKKLNEAGSTLYITVKNKGLYTSTIKAVKYSKAK